MNALHPFREGNGRSQREFARIVCKECGYNFNLSCTTHKEMLTASILSFNNGDNSLFREIFSKAITTKELELEQSAENLYILTSDDLTIRTSEIYDYYGYKEQKDSSIYNEMYKTKIEKMNAKKRSSK